MTSAKHAFLGVLAFAALVGAPAQASAQTATQMVKFEVQPINRIAVSGAPSLTIHAEPGRVATATSNASSWSVTTNQNRAKVTAALAAPMPNGLTLSVALAAPAGARSTGLQSLGTSPVDVVTNLSRLSAADLPMTYELEADVDAETNVSGTRAVTLTITGGA